MKKQAIYITSLSSTNEYHLFNCKGLANNAININFKPKKVS